MFDNLLRIAAAPVRVLDAVVVKPAADAVDYLASAFEDEEE